MHTLFFDLASPAKYVSGGWFATAESWLHPRRTIDTWVLIIGIKGMANIKISDNFFTVRPGDLLILPPNIEHSGYQSTKDVSYLWFHFSALDSDKAGESCISIPMYMHCTTHSRLVLLGIQLLHIEQAKYSSPLASNYQLSSLLLEIAEQYRQSLIHGEDSTRKIYEIQEWIRVNAHNQITLEQVSQQFHYNKNYLCKIFKKATGHTVQKHITLCKLEIVKQALLTEDLPIKQITELSGFTDEKYLMRVFRQYEGMTFTEFRNAYCRVHFNKK
ncbi:MAG: AraC family transcriptional regulator [Eubacteriales bacterium]